VFVTLSGCGLGLAMHRRVQVRPLARRVLVLVLVGLLYNAVTKNSWEPATWRLPGVLQLYAGIVLLLSLGHVATRSWRGWLALTLALAAAHATLLSVWARTCPTGTLTRQCNPSGRIDIAVFSADHVYAGGVLGHDPEGLVALLGAAVAAAAGATIAHLLLDTRAGTLRRQRAPRSMGATPDVMTAGTTARGEKTGVCGPRAAMGPLLLAAVFLAGAELAAHLPAWLGGAPLPAMKRLWTPPFTLTVTAAVIPALLGGHLLLDRPGTSRILRAGSWPLLALGRNSLLVYFGSHVAMAVLGYLGTGPDGTGRSLLQRAATAVAVAGHPQISWTVLVLAAWTALACLLHTRRWYLRP
jgi:predicted acyltransferase